MAGNNVYLNDVAIKILYNAEKARFEWSIGDNEEIKPRIVLNFSVKQYLDMMKDFSSHIIRLVDNGTIVLPKMIPHTAEEDKEKEK